MTKKEKENITKTVEAMGGEWVAPLACSHLLKIGEDVAKTITTERIAEEMKKTRQKEQEAEARGMVYLMSAEFVGEVLTAVMVLINQDDTTRRAIIKKYL